jgi:hypothetical protein
VLHSEVVEHLDHLTTTIATCFRLVPFKINEIQE